MTARARRGPTMTSVVLTAAIAMLAAMMATSAPPAHAQGTVTACGAAPAGMTVIESDARFIRGTTGDDFICAGPSVNSVRGLAGDDIIYGGAGSDRLVGGTGDDVIYGGAGNDDLIGYGGSDRMYGGDGNDTFAGGYGDDILDGGSGDDVLSAGFGADQLAGGPGNDRVIGGKGADTMTGGDGNDRLFGGWGIDWIDGGDGDDIIFGGYAADTLIGGAGNDTFYAGPGDVTYEESAPEDAPPNILLLIADDYGVESSACYPGLSSAPANTPTLDALCADGMVFDNAWSSPTCSPTRSGILTGRHGFRTGVGEQATGNNGIEIGADELTLPRVLDSAGSGYRHASFGKWHLGGDADNPNTMGWSHFSGLFSGALQDYSSWTKTVDGVAGEVTEYATTEIVNDTLSWIGDGEDPWFAWVAFNAPHTPFHLPPSELHTSALSGTAQDIRANPDDYYKAAVEALDTEIGRLLGELSPEVRSNTVVIFIGDNGTPGQVSEHAQGQAKGGLYEGGIHVPFTMSGPGVVPGRTNALVGTVDLFSTVLELAAVDAAQELGETVIDSVSVVDVAQGGNGSSEYVMSEIFGTQTADARQGKTIRDSQHKLIQFTNGQTAFFDLVADPRSQQPIDAAERTSAQSAAFDSLASVLAEWTASPTAPRAE